MVLTNFECWAHGGSENLSVSGLVERRGNSVDLFNPTVLPQTCNNTITTNDGNAYTAYTENAPNAKNISHFSSNGYYGFVAYSANNSKPVEDDVEVDVNNEQHEVKVAPAVDDTMDVEQHGCDMACSIASGLEFPATSFLPTRSNGGVFADRRKRVYGLDELNLVQGKRLRVDNRGNNTEMSKDDASAMSFLTALNHEHLAMEHEDDIKYSIAFSHGQSVLEFPDSNDVLSQHLRCEQSQLQLDANQARKQIKVLDLNDISRDPVEKSNTKCPYKVGGRNNYPFCHQTDNNNMLTTNSATQSYLSEYDVCKHEHFAVKGIVNEEACASDANFLESLFLSLHGGSSRHAWQHFSDYCTSNDDEI